MHYLRVPCTITHMNKTDITYQHPYHAIVFACFTHNDGTVKLETLDEMLRCHAQIAYNAGRIDTLKALKAKRDSDTIAFLRNLFKKK